LHKFLLSFTKISESKTDAIEKNISAFYLHAIPAFSLKSN